MFTPRSAADWRPPVVLLLGMVLLAGCGGGSGYRVSPSDLAEQYLPATRRVPHPPDTLRAVTVEEADDQLEITLSSSYDVLHRKWSSSFQNLGTGRSPGGNPLSYATLWGRDLSVAALKAEEGLTTLTLDRARELYEEREQSYDEVLQIDVYWFEAEGDPLLTSPGTRAELIVDGTRHRPTRKTHGPLQEAFLMQEGGRTLYRRNSFFFSRDVDGTELLDGADTVELMINRGGGGQRVRFAWTWDRP